MQNHSRNFCFLEIFLEKRKNQLIGQGLFIWTKIYCILANTEFQAIWIIFFKFYSQNTEKSFLFFRFFVKSITFQTLIQFLKNINVKLVFQWFELFSNSISKVTFKNTWRIIQANWFNLLNRFSWSIFSNRIGYSLSFQLFVQHILSLINFFEIFANMFKNPNSIFKKHGY